MGRINLDMSIPCFCADHVSSSIRVRIENILYGNVGLKSVREVCEMRESDLFKFRTWGKKSQMALKEALSECGLHLGMSDEELDEYQRAYEDEQKEAQIPKLVTSGYITCEMIDWEQRRWDMANKLYFWNEFMGHWKDAIEMADGFIEEYKQSLNKEE